MDRIVGGELARAIARSTMAARKVATAAGRSAMCIDRCCWSICTRTDSSAIILQPWGDVIRAAGGYLSPAVRFTFDGA
jgi:hypothetical protein